jgi:hypothetical protein
MNSKIINGKTGFYVPYIILNKKLINYKVSYLFEYYNFSSSSFSIRGTLDFLKEFQNLKAQDKISSH